jgi:hypothetical protein
MLSIKEAAKQGVERLRKPIWANPLDHVKIDIVEGKHGPWLHLWCPFNTECNGRDPVDTLSHQWDLDAPIFVAYDGPLPDSPEYRAAVRRFEGVLNEDTA